MPEYSIIFSKTAEKQLDKLDDQVAAPIFRLLKLLQRDPRMPGYKKLKGRSGYRIRKGNYRIIYEIIDAQLVIHVIAIGDRKDIYD